MLLREVETIEEEAVEEAVESPEEIALPASLVDQYYRAIFTFARQKLGNTHDAEDAAQETFARIQQGLSGYDGRSRMTTWLYVIGRNTVYDCLRKRRRSARFISWSEDLDRGVAPAEPPAPDPERVSSLISRLPPADRQMIAWVFHEKRSLRQIASETNEPVYRVRRRLQKVLSGLRAITEDPLR